MGVNIFVIVRNKIDPTQNDYEVVEEGDIEGIVHEINQRFGGDEGLFDWCDVFKGGSYLLTMEEALKLDQDEGPCFVVDTDIHECCGADGMPRDDKWKPLLYYKNQTAYSVLFLKARL